MFANTFNCSQWKGRTLVMEPCPEHAAFRIGLTVSRNRRQQAQLYSAPLDENGLETVQRLLLLATPFESCYYCVNTSLALGCFRTSLRKDSGSVFLFAATDGTEYRVILTSRETRRLAGCLEDAKRQLRCPNQAPASFGL